MSNFSFFHWFIVALVGFLVYSAMTRGKAQRDLVCKQCGHAGDAKSTVKGNLAIEIILWICFIIPGVIYSIWRLNTRGNSCPSCGSREMIPQNSPIGKKLLADQNAKL